MFKLLPLITALVFIFTMNSNTARGEDTKFTMPLDVLCDETGKLLPFLENVTGMVPIVRGLSYTTTGQILISIYATKDRVLVVGFDPKGFGCFITELNDSVVWYVENFELDIPKDIPKDSKILKNPL
tara:strand:+ start:1471 stop:1851 length:381 start_codon:yes stop_codon:yes gene_type:complete